MGTAGGVLGRAATCASSASCAGRGSCRCRICSCCRSVSTYCAARARVSLQTRQAKRGRRAGQGGATQGAAGHRTPESVRHAGPASYTLILSRRSCQQAAAAPRGRQRARGAAAGRRRGRRFAAAGARPLAGAHRQAALALLAARDELEQLVRLAQVAPDGLHLLHAILVVLAPPARLRPVDLLARPARAPGQALHD